MQAVILAAGRGLRMRPLTEAVPKPLLKVGGKTILDRALESLPGEVERVVVVVGYLQEQIRRHLTAGRFTKPVTFVEQRRLDGTATAVLACREELKGKFLVLNGDDLYRKDDLEKLLSFENGFLVKNAGSDPRYDGSLRRLGKVLFDGDGKLVDIVEGGEGSFLNIGAYILSEKFFHQEPVRIGNSEFGLPQTLVAMSRKGETVRIAEADFWIPIGYPEDLVAAEETLRHRNEIYH